MKSLASDCSKECQSCKDQCESCQLDVSFGIIEKTDVDEKINLTKQAGTQTMTQSMPNSRKALKLNIRKNKEKKIIQKFEKKGTK